MSSIRGAERELTQKASRMHVRTALHAPQRGGPSGAGRRERIRVWGPVAALVALCVLFSLTSPYFLSIPNVQALVDSAAIPLVLATGATFVILMGSIDLSIEGVTATASCLVALLVRNSQNAADLGYVGVLLTILVGSLIGLFTGLVVTRLRVPSFMATLGLWAIGLGVAAVLFGYRAAVVEDSNVRAIELTRWLGFPVEAYIGLGVVALGYFLQRSTRFGRYAYAIGADERAAWTAGIPVDRYKVGVFMFAAAMSALAGVMTVAKLGMSDSLAGSSDLFATLTAVVVGGTLFSGGEGGVLQSLVGVAIVVVLNNGMVQAGLDPLAQQGIEGMLIVVAVAATHWPVRQRLAVVK